jgi:hypothetical protein
VLSLPFCSFFDILVRQWG